MTKIRAEIDVIDSNYCENEDTGVEINTDDFIDELLKEYEK